MGSKQDTFKCVDFLVLLGYRSQSASTSCWISSIILPRSEVELFFVYSKYYLNWLVSDNVGISSFLLPACMPWTGKNHGINVWHKKYVHAAYHRIKCKTGKSLLCIFSNLLPNFSCLPAQKFAWQLTCMLMGSQWELDFLFIWKFRFNKVSCRSELTIVNLRFWLYFDKNCHLIYCLFKRLYF